MGGSRNTRKRRLSTDATDGSSTFDNQSTVQNQAGVQHNYGPINHAPICHYHKTYSGQDGSSAYDVEHLSYMREHASRQENEQPRMACLASGLPSLIEKRQNYLGLLKVESMDARRADIDLAHSQTCRWLFGSPQYKNWLDPKEHGENHGFFWLRGNPGTGKSTITKFACSDKNVMYGTVIASFFSARGEALQKTTEGMYRSLLFQLLEKLPDLQCVLDHLPTISADARPRLSVSTLKELFQSCNRETE